MSFDFNTLYQEWVDYIRTHNPSCPDDKLTVDNYINNVQCEVEDYINEGEEVPPSLLFILNNHPPQG